MQDMFGLAMLFELSRKDGRRKHEFDHLCERTPIRSRLYRLVQSLLTARKTKGPA